MSKESLKNDSTQSSSIDIIKKIIILIVLIIAGWFIYDGVSNSSFAKVKTYDNDVSPRELAKKIIQVKTSGDARFNAKISDNGMANLGDMKMSISGNRELEMNMSLKLKDKKSGLFDSLFGSDIDDEFIEKSTLLKHSVINVMSNTKNVDINNQKMKDDLIKKMNNNLSSGKIKDIYFNDFIIK